MTKRNIVLTEFAIRIFRDRRIDWDGFDRFLWELLHGADVRRIAVSSNSPGWRKRRKFRRSRR